MRKRILVGTFVVVLAVSLGLFLRVRFVFTQENVRAALAAPARIRVDTLHIGTDLRALISRRIEHAALRLSGARVSQVRSPTCQARPESSPSKLAR